MLTFDIAGAQIDGARDYQEDAFLITRLGDSTSDRTASLVIVADGMGGHAAGNVASNMAVQTFNKHLTSNFPGDSLPAVLREAVTQANQSITETVRETAALKGMGCTLVAILIEDIFLRWVSVGDSHLYLIRNREIKKKNADHSYGGFLTRMAEQGKPIEPEAGFSRNMLMSALTGDDIADIDCPETPLELLSGDRIVVASDGLDTLSHGKLLSFMESTNSAKECAEALLKAVQDTKMPRQDNTTVVVVIVGEKPDAKVTRGSGETANDAPAQPPPRFAPVPIDDTPERSGMGKRIALAIMLLLAGGGVGYWYLSAPSGTPAMKPLGTDDPNAASKPASVDSEPGDSEAPAAVTADADEPPAAAVETPAPTAAPSPPTAGTGETFHDPLRSGGQGPRMVWAPAGSFMMGSPESAADFNERPQHQVRLGKFAIGVYEVTIADYARFAAATGHKLPKTGDLDRSTHPVFFVSWNDALAYAKWLSAQTGKDYRLPSEAEWEYAARGGTSSNYWWGRDLGQGNAHCFACETGLDPRQPTKIGRFKANPYGLYDTSGNVQEWTYDCYHDNYEGAPNDGSVFEGGDCKHRVVRGGAYSSGPKALRSTARDKFAADGANDSIGLRVVRSQ